ncbi:MAG: glycosyltransferase [Mucilaginibacter polytrichastri]|nr:glycosyltransferase [Mucilaginibacter polytrichastri]
MAHVSVIIPAYNCRLTLPETLQSVFDQDVAAEVIIVNDGSTDGTAELVDSYHDRCTIIHTENRGAALARQTGLDASNGQYIQYLDADDLLLPGKIQEQVKALKTQNADIAYGDWTRFTGDGAERKTGEVVTKTLPEPADIALFTDFWWPPAALLFSRKITCKISWNKNLPVIQDARYMLDAALAGARFVHTPQQVVLYRTAQSGSLSARSEKAFVHDCFVNAKELYTFWQADLQKDSARKNALIKVLRFVINRASVLNARLAAEASALLTTIAPGYIPEEKGALQTLSKMFGYRRAEYIAGFKRRLRS